MTDHNQAIPYASTAKPNSGIRLATILAIFATVHAAREFLENLGLLEFLQQQTGRPIPSAAMVTLQRLNLFSIICCSIGATLLFARRSAGGVVVAVAVVFAIIITAPLFYATMWTSSGFFHGAPYAARVLVYTVAALNWIAAAAAVCLICHLAVESCRSLRTGSNNWPSLRTTCAWSILLYGVCQTFAFIIPTAQEVLAGQGDIYWSSALPISAASLFLTLGGLGALLHRPWSRHLCIVGAVAWGLHPNATFAYYIWQSRNLLWFTQFMDARWFAGQLQAIPLATLWVLLLLHPQLRAHWRFPPPETPVPDPLLPGSGPPWRSRLRLRCRGHPGRISQSRRTP